MALPCVAKAMYCQSPPLPVRSVFAFPLLYLPSLPGTATRVDSLASHRKQTTAQLPTRNVPSHQFFAFLLPLKLQLSTASTRSFCASDGSFGGLIL
jgi:hypothetical protein